MFTEQSLRDHPSLVKAFVGISAEHFWELIEQTTSHFANSPSIFGSHLRTLREQSAIQPQRSLPQSRSPSR
jgi:hypothetical protein